ncbi:MAG: pyridoxamine 5'-phosphate oxidase family protein [Candidatus Andersenbacteria bacterium]|nr:pyridoxamine 5'-phosphate oxidase family protein [Candidatus Andersenbacteria bacterium]MBI3250486.1 pyridoxamine 5'-phosphate oxidase family protein [Candidatus Andersenbacteria bacterium]
MEDNKRLISKFIATQILGVVATVNEQSKPESALVAITEAGNLDLIFGTSNQSRKYRNLINRPHVAITLGNDPGKPLTVQYEGEAIEIKGSEMERYRDLHIKKNPRSKKFAERSDQRWFKVKPTWIRYSDLEAKPPNIFELKL